MAYFTRSISKLESMKKYDGGNKNPAFQISESYITLPSQIMMTLFNADSLS